MISFLFDQSAWILCLGTSNWCSFPWISFFKAGHGAVKWAVPAVLHWGRRASKAIKVMPILPAFLQGLAGMVLFWNLTDLSPFFSATLGKLSQKFPWELCCICSHCISSPETPLQASGFLSTEQNNCSLCLCCVYACVCVYILMKMKVKAKYKDETCCDLMYCTGLLFRNAINKYLLNNYSETKCCSSECWRWRRK